MHDNGKRSKWMMDDGLMRTLQIIAALLLLSAQVSQASIPPLYNVTFERLDNGMGVILKERGDSKNVSIRLGVDVGLEDFACHKREIPHFLEHLLFTGTSKHGEYELERMLNDRGGASNASTERFQTTYKVDIHSDHVRFALEFLHEIMTDSVIAPGDVETSRNIIFRERGGERSRFMEMLFENGINRGAMSKMGEYVGYICNILTSPKGVTRDEIVAAFDKYYVPGNMVITVVGMFSEEKVLEILNNTFGQLPVADVSHDGRRKARDIVNGPKEFVGSFSPVLATDAMVAMAYMVPGNKSQEKYPLKILEYYLHDKVFKKVRIDNGLGYSPNVGLASMDDVGLLVVRGDVDFDEMDQVQALFQQEIDAVSRGDIDESLFNKTKQYVLLSYEQGYETNADHADYYVDHHYQLTENGRLFNQDEAIANVTIDEFSALAKRHLTPENQMIAKDYPTLSYHQLFVGMGLFLLVVGFLMVRYFVRHRGRS